MIIKCKILSYDEANHNIIVRYYSDEVSEDDLANFFDKSGNIVRKEDNSPLRCKTDFNINLNLSEYQEFSLDKLKETIKKYIPIKILENNKIKIDLNKLKNEIESLIDKEIQFDDVIFENKNIEDYVKEIIKDL